jgi:RNA polymerase sigma-70 factor, ECF subfamily
MPHLIPTATPRHRMLDPEAAAGHLDRVYRLAWSLCGSSHLADELTQETYARVLARPRRLRGDSELQYLTRTLRNLVRDHWRTQRRALTVVGSDALEEVCAQTAGPEAVAMAGEVLTAVARLPPPMREVIGLVDVAGLSYAETADALGVPVGTVMSRLHRARSKVVRSLAPPAMAA